MTNPPAADKPETKISRIKVLSYHWTAWPHEFNRLMLKYQISHSFFVTLLYLWKATVGNDNYSSGELALTQIPVRRKHAEKWLAALCESGLFTVEKATLGSQEGSYYEYREDATVKDWDRLFHVLAQIELLGGLDDKFSVKKFGQMVASAFKPDDKAVSTSDDDFVQVDDATKLEFLRKHGKRVSGKTKKVDVDEAATKRALAAALERFERATLRKPS